MQRKYYLDKFTQTTVDGADTVTRERQQIRKQKPTDDPKKIKRRKVKANTKNKTEKQEEIERTGSAILSNKNMFLP